MSRKQTGESSRSGVLVGVRVVQLDHREDRVLEPDRGFRVSARKHKKKQPTQGPSEDLEPDGMERQPFQSPQRH